jgi:hypothetical protein
MRKPELFSGFFCINVLGLCEEAELEAQMFIIIPNVQFCTEPAFLQNACSQLAFLSVRYGLRKSNALNSSLSAGCFNSASLSK